MSNSNNRPIKKGDPGPKKKLFEKICEDHITNEWGMSFRITLKKRISKRDQNEDDYYLNIASSGGRWFVTFPTYMWGPMKKAIDKMMKGTMVPKECKL